ncbi:protein phosphatase 2C domain-containing protein [Phthorimaea operculella]|nr:protein phosphatase 2C domain-containing protein [Phthorimaea operculella]
MCQIELYVAGWVQLNLALSRALGDYVFKRNYRLAPQDQIVTAGWVQLNLALSRALGDYVFKRNYRLAPQDQTSQMCHTELYVVGWVQLNLALSRALGDYVFKRNYRLAPQDQIVTAYPDVQVRQINDDWEFIVIACDGIWEVLSNEEVISFCRARLQSGWEPAAVCEALMQRCLAPNCATGGLGCDNMTVLIICLAPFPRNTDQRCLAPNCATGGLGCDNMTVLIICLAPFPRNTDQVRIVTSKRRGNKVSNQEYTREALILMQCCLAPNCATGGLGCDNMTVLIICLAPFPRNTDQVRHFDKYKAWQQKQ